MNKRDQILIIILVILVAMTAYFLLTKSGTQPSTANVVQGSDTLNECTSDSEPQCMNHKIGASCTNVRDGGIPGKCIERYEACVCR